MKISYYSLVLLCAVALWGCSNGNSSSPAVIDQTTGKHATGWALNGNGGAHPLAYFDNPAGCQECHGKELLGGISGVSCSNPGRSGVACHATFPHPPGFADFNVHGNSAKAAPGSFTGMAHCQKCHGDIYTGKGPAPSCIACHKTSDGSNAPHASNWVTGANLNTLKHSTTDSGNAPACFQCHAGGKYSHAAPVPAPPGTAPGCFNGTMCHNAAGHAFTVAGHLIPALQNLASCQTCHATPSTGPNPRFTVPKNTTLTPNGCENCHNRPGLAHPYVWLPGRGTTLVSGTPVTNSTSHANAQNVVASCGLCHGGAALTGGAAGSGYPGGIDPPSCFRPPAALYGGTACHFTKPINAGGTTIGCGSCHGDPTSPTNNGMPSSSVSTAAPNRSFRHIKHFAINATITNSAEMLTCGVCHSGLGTGTTTHSTKLVFSAVTAPTAIAQAAAPFFNDGGVASYSSSTGRCSNVSCHGSAGGFVLPNMKWKEAGTLPATDCAFNCHETSLVAPSAYTGIYIGPFSGNNIAGGSLAGPNLHVAHLNSFGATECRNCHNVTGVHFNKIMLGRRTLAPGFAAGTVGGAGTAIGSYTYTSPTSSSCVTAGSAQGLSCHDGGGRSWYK